MRSRRWREERRNGGDLEVEEDEAGELEADEEEEEERGEQPPTGDMEHEMHMRFSTKKGHRAGEAKV